MKIKKDDLVSVSVIDSVILNDRSLKYWLNHPMLFSIFCVELIFGIIGGILGLIFDNILCLIVGLVIGILVGICVGLKVRKVTRNEKNYNMATIGIDIDDTIVQTNKKALEIIEREGYECVDYYEKLSNLSKFITDHFVEIVQDSILFDGCGEVLKKLKEKGYRIVLISSRAFQNGADTEDDTIEYLKNNDIVYDVILLKRPNKVDACLQESVDYFIDDKEKTLDTLAEIGVKCIKMQSIDKDSSKYYSVNSWQEILKYFENLEK